MKRFFFFLSLVFFCLSSNAHNLIEEKCENYIDSVFKSVEINFELIQAEFTVLIQEEFKLGNDLKSALDKLVSKKKNHKKKDLKFEIANPKKYKQLASLSVVSDDLLVEITVNIFNQIYKSKLWVNWEHAQKAAIFLYTLNSNTLENETLSSLAIDLSELFYEMNSKSLHEKISIIILISKLYNHNITYFDGELVNHISKSKSSSTIVSRILFSREMTGTVHEADVDSIFDKPEYEPEFIGGELGMAKFIQKTVVYPEISKMMGEQGTVYVRFIVNRDGSVSDTEIIKGISAALDAETLRIINAMPPWIPGTIAGKAVRVSFVIPVKYAIS